MSSQPAARINDMHVCPMAEPGPVPHVGGPIFLGAPTVLIENQPAARANDLATCTGPVDAVLSASATVVICGQHAARLNDTTCHGGTIMSGAPTVWIG